MRCWSGEKYPSMLAAIGSTESGTGADRRRGLHESLVVLDTPGQGGRQLRQRFPVRLAHIEHLHRAEHGDFNFPFLHDRLALCIQDGGFGVGSSFCSSIFFLNGVGAMMVIPCSPFFTWRSN